MKTFLIGASAAISLLTATPAFATIVVDTGTPTGTTNFLMGAGQDVAGLFTLTDKTFVDTVEGFINSTAVGTITVTIYGNGALPDSSNILFSQSFASTVTPVEGAWQGVSVQGWTLEAGTYWVGFSSPLANGMRNGAPNPLAAYAFTNNGTWFQNPLGVGVRVGGGVPLLPEPGSWAMMITGFGFVGGMMRRRVTKVSYAI